ncbi:MAG: LPS export ABC transporter permease LptF [Rhodobiaceae bacterium]|nr:MAG: LPS export ABC transporter permease LptF [Rhodobiaceae bacterium]
MPGRQGISLHESRQPMFSGFTRYIFVQAAGPFLLASLALTGIIWLTQALRLLDVIIGQGQSAGTYFLLTLLSIPSLLTLILPISLFIGVLYALHRLYSDSELVVMFSSGISRWGIARPFLFLCGVVSLVVFALSTYIAPAGLREVKSRLYEIRTDFASALIREGAFNTPINGLTVYVRERKPDGTIMGILVHDNRDPAKPVTYMAETGTLVSSNSRPRLIMFNGNIQRANKSDGGDSLSLLYFDKYTYDLSQFASNPTERYYEGRERYLWDLIWPASDDIYARNYRNRLTTEAHDRIAGILYSFMFGFIALASLLSAEFNRRGYAARLAIAAVLALGARLFSLTLYNATVSYPSAAVLMYLFPAAVCGLCAAHISGVKFDRWFTWVLILVRRPVRGEA